MKIIGISASPRKGSNSGILLDHGASAIATEVEHYRLRECGFSKCRACDTCTGEHCVNEDDADALWEKIAHKDCIGLFISVPVWFATGGGEWSKFLFRSRKERHANYALRCKPFACAAVAGRRDGGGELTIDGIHRSMRHHGMMGIGNLYDSCHHGCVAIASKPGDVIHDTLGMDRAISTMRSLELSAWIYHRGITGLEFVEPKFCPDSGTMADLQRRFSASMDDNEPLSDREI